MSIANEVSPIEMKNMYMEEGETFTSVGGRLGVSGQTIKYYVSPLLDETDKKQKKSELASARKGWGHVRYQKTEKIERPRSLLREAAAIQDVVDKKESHFKKVLAERDAEIEKLKNDARENLSFLSSVTHIEFDDKESGVRYGVLLDGDKSGCVEIATSGGSVCVPMEYVGNVVASLDRIKTMLSAMNCA